MADEEHKDYSEREVQERFELIGRQMVEHGLYAEAVEAYKELLRDFPASRWAANAMLALAQCYHAMGQEQDELETLEDLIAEFPDHVVARRARDTIGALRERPQAVTGAAADLHGAVRRLTRQVERMRQAQRRRAWMGAVAYAVLLALLVWTALRALGGPGPALDDVETRLTALESAVEALSEGAPPSAAEPSRPSPAPAATVTPVPPEPTPPAPAAQPPATPPRPPAPPPAPAARTYTVKQGDSLWRIAQRELGDGTRGDEIARLNGLQAADKIQVGDKLKLPAR